MTTNDPAGYSEAAAHVFTWLADKLLGGTKKVVDWGWNHARWAAAQDRYDAQIIANYGEIRVFGQTKPKPLRDIFTDVYVLDQPTAFRRFNSNDLTDHVWTEDRGISFQHADRRRAELLLKRLDKTKFVILGKPGAGKTTFLKRLAVREAQRGAWGECLGKIPILVTIKAFAESGLSLFDFILRQFSVCYFPDAAPFVEGLLKSGKALVLFDGLDEAPTTPEAGGYSRGQVTEMLSHFAYTYDLCHIVITCRIAATEYMFAPTFTYLEISDFVPTQVATFVRNWFWNTDEPEASIALANRMLDELRRPEHISIRDLGRNPLLLTLLCLNYAETLSFPARRVEIYEEALDALLKKWDTSRQIKRGGLYYRALSLGRKRQMFARVAYDAFRKGENIFRQESLEAWLSSYLEHVPELPDAIDIDMEGVLKEIVAQHGIFTEQAHRLFSFAHLTFQEYFAARFIVENAASDAVGTLERHITDDKWREVCILTASMLSDATEFLTRFEQIAHELLTTEQRLASWMRATDTVVGTFQTGYDQSAIRFLYIIFLTSQMDNHLGYNSQPYLLALRTFALDLIHATAPDLYQDRELAVLRARVGTRPGDLILYQRVGQNIISAIGSAQNGTKHKREVGGVAGLRRSWLRGG